MCQSSNVKELSKDLIEPRICGKDLSSEHSKRTVSDSTSRKKNICSALSLRAAQKLFRKNSLGKVIDAVSAMELTFIQ